ncbi:unnamed protein product [Macrosiphum euphorbiae]|uniref:Leucine-rich repeat-containing protein 51 n=1 Tax=Macrosiphum euphorbiae TaxID=13131 RepID=A0AAV0WWB7_9HEMI|nr:unnamed protein product [Macrosiphum euphorbiae]
MKSMKVPFSYKRAKPLDLSFEDLESLLPSSLRVFSTGFVNNIRLLVDKLLWQPNALCWLDLSHNQLTDLSDALLGFPNLSTLYLHHNRLASLCAVARINRLPKLRSVTLQNNPVAEYHGYRTAVLSVLKRITRLDFVSVTEKLLMRQKS